MTKSECKLRTDGCNCDAFPGVKCDSVNESVCLAARQAYEIGNRKAMSEEPRQKGEWKYEERTVFGDTTTSVICPFCGRLDLFYGRESKEEAEREHRHLNHNFCHYCGTDMRGAK